MTQSIVGVKRLVIHTAGSEFVTLRHVARRMVSEKTPSSKRQSPEKLQVSKLQSCQRATNCREIELGVWIFPGAWRLVLGASRFDLPWPRRAEAAPRRRMLGVWILELV
jgi:hypothetical protein